LDFLSLVAEHSLIFVVLSRNQMKRISYSGGESEAVPIEAS